MASKKKPATARKRKAPLAVLAWAFATGGQINIWGLEYSKEELIRQYNPHPSERIIRVRIVEVRR